ncbi:hypothetical protein GOZ96_12325 [Agrobacterium vitis]|uniref:Uncharacterized protein n=1 Tax=Agrobacterium vitis TaxID=373 RepID=A0A368NNZ4_AGRVI|nr:hypothetical protein [Agrobacterium vitis]KAA3516968.1 hypothetical protein DXM22_10970 [Agrobacterium vitis]KAA3529733.1 hypothetical protein DXT89_08495 [Agrobacterium vitis]MUZ97388.1 hypothetical protein [Agrobacterium vitis]NOJ36234.1 hypothetical protein [Agrobacterium vitis]RCU52287.1 hypothetical protein ASB66_019330 [Agrobacterium vitis]
MDDVYKEEYRVKYTRDAATKRILGEAWFNAQGELDRNDDLPTRVAYDDLGRVCEMEWSRRNITHRESGPSRIEINPESGIVCHEVWCFEGEVHRAGGEPAVIDRDPDTGQITRVEFWDMGTRISKKSFRKSPVQNEPNLGL